LRQTKSTEKQVRSIEKSPYAVVRPFGGEGTGLQSIIRYSWTTGEVYKFRVEAEPNKAKHETTYSGFVWLDEKWTLISRLLATNDGAYLSGIYSFIENWTDDRTEPRVCEYFDQQYQRASTGDKYHIVTKCTTTHNQKILPTEHFKFSVIDKKFCLSIDGCGELDDACSDGQCKCCTNPGCLCCD